MADSRPVHFFDLTSTLPGTTKSWSPNTLKVRLVLNFKGVPYTQSWVSYPDIAPLMKALDVDPNGTGTPYTLPAINHKASVTTSSSGTMMDSLPIAQHLDKVYPSPPLFPSGDASYALAVAVARLTGLMAPSIMLLVIPRVTESLDPRGKEYFDRTRSELFGKPLSEVRPTDEETLLELGRDGKTGPFFEGEKAGYADFIMVSVLAFFHRFDREVWEKMLGLGEGQFKALWDACSPWLEGQGEEKEWPVPQ
ncbi:hypothetical protein NUU61_000638 [Penicillium alfredii]|uniref:GST N-terminal domain-containing protein n=1 Tax=Penicillium alfredii TaxID=1506179 RepID=A0A9W9G9Y9_9EURO|nr:uncharacterized protein NUU61_000638 [Penicillium alfredii]KAJ5114879.1 hypothetical protein NUU61_000638 [Penicillium alfredii]